MGESKTHALLRGAIVRWLEEQFGQSEAAAALIDDPDSFPSCFPPSIEGFTPDVFFRQTIRGISIIGEAKTSRDLETKHSREQFAGYFKYLSSHPGSILVVAVPWHTANQAKSLLWYIQKRCNARDVSIVVLEKLPG